MRRCPYCGERIRSKAIVCRFCGKEQPALIGQERQRKEKTPIFLIISTTIQSLFFILIGILIIIDVVQTLTADDPNSIYFFYPLHLLSGMFFLIIPLIQIFLIKKTDQTILLVVNMIVWFIITMCICYISAPSPSERIIEDAYRGRDSIKSNIAITNNDLVEINPSWSPDGSNIVFVAELNGNYDLFTVNQNGDNLKRLTNTVSDELNPDWSPDGDWIAYSSNETVFKMNISTGEIVQLTEEGDGGDRPLWSKNGNEIVFVRWGRIIVINNMGEYITEFHPTAYHGVDLLTDVSPDGQILIYNSITVGYNDRAVYIDNFLSNTSEYFSDAQYGDLSNDGKLIVMKCLEYDDNGVLIDSFICTHHIPTSIPREYKEIGNSGDNPRWDSDGKRIVYECDFNGRREICVITLH